MKLLTAKVRGDVLRVLRYHVDFLIYNSDREQVDNQARIYVRNVLEQIGEQVVKNTRSSKW